MREGIKNLLRFPIFALGYLRVSFENPPHSQLRTTNSQVILPACFSARRVGTDGSGDLLNLRQGHWVDRLWAHCEWLCRGMAERASWSGGRFVRPAVGGFSLLAAFRAGIRSPISRNSLVGFSPWRADNSTCVEIVGVRPVCRLRGSPAVIRCCPEGVDMDAYSPL